MILQNIDLIIFSAFLGINFFVGIFYYSSVTNISEYAVGDRNFSTSTLVATLVATWIGAGFFAVTLTETYRQGLYFIIPNIGDGVVLILMGMFFAPRMGEFLGNLSIAEAMGKMFGPYVRLVTSVVSIIVALGTLGGQFKVSAKVLEVFFSTSGTAATIISAAIVIIYSTFGGIKAVTFTDVLQFFTFGCIMPIVAIIAWDALGNNEMIWDTLSKNPSFNIKQVFNLHNPSFYKMMGLCIFFTLPKFSLTSFQRVAMARSTNQAASAFKTAGFICLAIQLFVVSLAIFILADNPNLDPSNLLGHILNRYAYPGLKGLMAAGIMAMIMSTADSLLNAMSIMFAHDICKPLGFQWANNELLISRLFAIFSGITAIYLALKFGTIFSLFIFSHGTYLSLITIPFIFAVLGFRSSGVSVLIGMIAGAVSMVIFSRWPLLPVDSFLPGMFFNMVFLFGSHYLLKQTGGWVGISGSQDFIAYKQEKIRARRKLINSIIFFDPFDFVKKGLPEGPMTISYFGFFSIVSVCITKFSFSQITNPSHTSLINFLYTSVLVLSFNLLTYPIWPATLKKEKVISIFWLVSVFYMAVCVPTIFVLISNFLPTQLMIFLLNFVAISVMLRWNVSLLLMLTGVPVAIYFLNYFVQDVASNIASMQFKITYFLLLLSSILIAFLKPAQQLSDKNSKLLAQAASQLQDMSEQTLNLLIMKQEFINNINHEIRTPLNHISLGAVALHKNQNNLSDINMKESIELIYNGYKRLQDYVGNILDLSNFNTNKVTLNYQDINFQELVENVLEECKQIYLENPDLSFQVNVNTMHLITRCDPEKMSQAIKYLIKNAIAFTKKGVIEILLEEQEIIFNKKKMPFIKCSVIDEGVGIPEEELHYIFGPFVQSSYTKNISGGKGLGLALCHRIIELHKGQIWANNNSSKQGATFSLIIPMAAST